MDEFGLLPAAVHQERPFAFQTQNTVVLNERNDELYELLYNLLLTGMLLPQVCHLSPQSLVLSGTIKLQGL
uniref:Uncharacterized protein n=1 Tax=Anguilla anguilla TaxID=7936 RepID=A0A0E9RBR8_ANGAN